MLNFHSIPLCISKWFTLNRLPPLVAVDIFLFAMWYDSVPLGQRWYVPADDAISMIMLNFAHHFKWTTDNSIVKYFTASIHRHYQKQSNVTAHTHTGTLEPMQMVYTRISRYQHPIERNTVQKSVRKAKLQTWYKYEHFIVAESHINEQNIIYYVRNNDTLLFYASFYYQPQLSIRWPFHACLISPHIRMESSWPVNSVAFSTRRATHTTFGRRTTQMERYIDACSFVLYKHLLLKRFSL